MLCVDEATREIVGDYPADGRRGDRVMIMKRIEAFDFSKPVNTRAEAMEIPVDRINVAIKLRSDMLKNTFAHRVPTEVIAREIAIAHGGQMADLARHPDTEFSLDKHMEMTGEWVELRAWANVMVLSPDTGEQLFDMDQFTPL